MDIHCQFFIYHVAGYAEQSIAFKGIDERLLPSGSLFFREQIFAQNEPLNWKG